jgi:hypothetical protein
MGDMCPLLKTNCVQMRCAWYNNKCILWSILEELREINQNTCPG